MEKRFLQFRITAMTVMIGLLFGVVGMMKGHAETKIIGDLVYDLNASSLSATIIRHKNESSATGTLVIPETVTNNGITYSVNSIATMAFYYCRNLSGCLIIPNTITSIGDAAFFNCTGFSEIQYKPTNCTVINPSYTYSPFYGCSGQLVIDTGVERIPDYMFKGAAFTGTLSIPNAVTIIGSSAFSGCIGFSGELIVPNSVTQIGAYAFYNCNGINNAVFLNTMTTIREYAFDGCSGITEMLMLGTIPPSLGSSAFANSSFPIYVPYESINDYKTATNWSNYEDRIFPTAYRSIPSYGDGNSSWQFIASPLAENTAPTEINNMIPSTGTYDLYRFNQSVELEWQNYKAHTNDFTLANGQGYLYANAEDVNLIFKGEFNEEATKEVGLAYDAKAALSGWNLVGNPFPVSAYANRSYYVMNEDGTAIEPVAVSMETAIPACTGVMVKADNTGETVTFSKTAPEAAVNQGVLQIAVAQANTRGNAVEDKAIVSFNVSDHLEKFVFNEDNATISIPQGGKDFAIAKAEKMGQMLLNFKATKNGEYTITVNPEAVEMDYLHLIDNMKGNDIDLLALPNYSFNAQTTDYASRFRLVFFASEGADGDNGAFAYFRDGEIVITTDACDASLQVIDMMGRIVVCRDAARHVSTEGMTPGVYVLRLLDGDDVRTQKIVIQ